MGLLIGSAGAATADGNVIVYLDRDGNLVVIGDAEDNNITICPGDCDGRGPFGVPDNAYQVWSLDNYFRPDTTVNGLPGYPGVWFVPPGKLVRVNMGGGNDLVRVEPTWFKDLELVGGEGDDILSLTGLQLYGNIVVVGGPGNDRTGGSEGFDLEGNLYVDLGEGSDFLGFDGATVGRRKGTCFVKMGPGDDQFFPQEGVDFRGPVHVDLGPGNDVARVEENVRFFGDFALLAGSEDDVLKMEEVQAFGRVVLDGGEGQDLYMDLHTNLFTLGIPKAIRFEAVGIPSWNRPPSGSVLSPRRYLDVWERSFARAANAEWFRNLDY